MDIQQEIRSLFSENGVIPSATGFEFRPQQLAMATAIGQTLESTRHLIIEAPTGVGKSLAYLVPALLYALNNERKAVISTYTKNLQEQLFRKDIPLVKRLINRDFTAVLLKGRRNYLCTSRLANALAHQKSFFERKALQDLERIQAWAETTPDGDVENLPFVPLPEVWQQVCSEQGTCTPKQCGSGCFYQRAKERTRSADLIVVNHALFFSLFALQGSEEYFLYENDFVIFDEAHTLEQVAGVGAGKSVSRAQVLFAIHRIYNPRTKRGLLTKRKKKELTELCAETEEAAVAFFDEIKRKMSQSNGPSKTLRIHSPNFIPNSLASALQRLQSAVKDLEENEKISIQKDELAGARRLLWEAEMLIAEFINQNDKTLTYWIEQSEGRTANIVLNAAPTSVAESVGPRLFRPGSSIILTSATLSVSGSLRYFQQRVGALDAETVILDSPFDFQRQMRVVIAQGIPPPDQPKYESDLPQWIVNAIKRSKGKALVLFTSAALLRKMRDSTAGLISDEGYTVLSQERGTQRHALLEEFKRDVHSVLFGLDSFWMGVDVPGEALEHVIITKLPFAVPDHPLTEARLELIAQHGGNPFMEFTLPEAILKLRQGVGRLIRGKTDRGMITILDARILTKQYGQAFLRSLPRCPVEVVSQDGVVEEITLDPF
jgi:ATP-dependent DNA helicase DinG